MLASHHALVTGIPAYIQVPSRSWACVSTQHAAGVLADKTGWNYLQELLLRVKLVGREAVVHN